MQEGQEEQEEQELETGTFADVLRQIPPYKLSFISAMYKKVLNADEKSNAIQITVPEQDYRSVKMMVIEIFDISMGSIGDGRDERYRIFDRIVFPDEEIEKSVEEEQRFHIVVIFSKRFLAELNDFVVDSEGASLFKYQPEANQTIQ